MAIVPLFSPNEYAVKRDIVINKPKNEVFEYVKMLKNQDQFSEWVQKDPDMKKSFEGSDGTVGFVSKWESQKEEVGKGEQEIIAIEEGKRIDYELRFIEPSQSKDHSYIITEKVGEGNTKVTWGFEGKISYPMNGTLLFMDIEEDLGESFQKGLEQLKVILENKA
jgi:uncharacterized protein YndB with AHSA1/START domain